MKILKSGILLILIVSFLAFLQTTTYAIVPCCSQEFHVSAKECTNNDLTKTMQLIFCRDDQVCDTTQIKCVDSPTPTPKPTIAPTGIFQSVFGNINPPKEISAIGVGSAGISNLLNKMIQLIYVVAGIIFVFMIIISAMQWILSGGEKEAVSKARGRLTWAVVGIVFLALAFVIISVIGTITGFTFFVGQ